MQVLLDASQRTVNSGPLGAFVSRFAHYTLIELFLILSADPILKMMLSLYHILFNRSVDAPIVKGVVNLILCRHLTPLRFSMDTGHHRIGDISAPILFLYFIPRLFSRFSTTSCITLCTFGEKVIYHVLGPRKFSLVDLNERLIKGFARCIVTSMSSVTDILFEREVVASSSAIVPIGLEASRNIVWVMVELPHLRQYLRIYRNFIKSNYYTRITLFHLVLNHPGMLSYLPYSKSLTLVATQNVGN